MKFQQIVRQVKQIEKNRNLLLEENTFDEKINSFMKSWYNIFNSSQDGTQYSYVWSLVYGWQLEQLNKQLITTPPQSFQTTFVKEIPKKLIDNHDEGFLKEENNFVKYISKNQIFIQFQNNFFWTNPSNAFATINHLNEKKTFIFVLTTSNIENIINFLIISKTLINFRLITTQHIYRKMKKLISFLNSFQNNIQQPPTYLLKSDQYFQYANIIWLIRQNCWYESSCDLALTFNHTKQSFLIECEKLTETKLIYYGWKKNLILEQNYQKYIRQWDKSIIRPNSQKKDVYRIEKLQSNHKKDKNYWYLHFIKKELIEKLTSTEQDQLFACCELVELIPHQIIAKKNYLFDYMYLLLQGDFQLKQCKDQAQPTKANTKSFYGLNQLTSHEPTYSFTLQSTSKATIFRIQKSNVLFHLYDLLI